MSHHSKSVRHQSPEHRKLAQAYAARIVIGKLVLVLAGSASLAVVFILGTVHSATAIGAIVFGCACFAAIFVGDFPAWARCPACGRKMKVRTHDDARPYKRYRYLACTACKQTVDLGADEAFRAS
jgi:endogenous inhibitor of DNA gyrase (YacG/DUF329 family)